MRDSNDRVFQQTCDLPRQGLNKFGSTCFDCYSHTLKSMDLAQEAACKNCVLLPWNKPRNLHDEAMGDNWEMCGWLMKHYQVATQAIDLPKDLESPTHHFTTQFAGHPYYKVANHCHLHSSSHCWCHDIHTHTAGCLILFKPCMEHVCASTCFIFLY